MTEIKNFKQIQVTSDYREQLKKKILDGFKSGKLFKGFNETVNQLKVHNKMQLYIAGELDYHFEQILLRVLKQTGTDHVGYILPANLRSIVHQAIKLETVSKKEKTQKRYFNTRLFGLSYE